MTTVVQRTLDSTERIRRALLQLRSAVDKGREYPEAEWDAVLAFDLSTFETRRMRAWYDDGWTPPAPGEVIS